MAGNLLTALLLLLSTLVLRSQDYAIDLGYMIQEQQSIQERIDFTSRGVDISFTGYFGIGWNATQIGVGTSQLELEREIFIFDPMTGNNIRRKVTTEATTIDISLINWFYINDELNGFAFGYGGRGSFSEPYIVINGILYLAYRFNIAEKFSIRPSISGNYGAVIDRNDSFDSFGSFGYGGRLSVGYVF